MHKSVRVYLLLVCINYEYVRQLAMILGNGINFYDSVFSFCKDVKLY